jgi:GT2 family glycosyltransferase
MKASIIIPNFNGQELLAKNLPYVIKALNNKENNIFEIIVVDDGSEDGSVKLLKNNFPQVKVIKHTKNRGFSAAVNTGVRGSSGDLIVLLNSDVVPNEDFLVNALPHFKNPKVFAVSLHEKGYGWAKGGFKDGYIQILPGEESETFHESFYVSGGSGVFRRSIWMELEGMDEKLLSPYYWEDIDLCYRAAKRGYIVGWEPESCVIHNHESTISKLSKEYVARIKERNQLLCLWKNLTSPNLVRKHVMGIFARLARHPGYLRVVLMAVCRLGIALKKKRREIKESEVSDEAIFARFS